MGWSFKIGTVNGIAIKIHLTFFLVIIWAMARGSSGFGGVGGALAATVSILLLFVCVMLHELGHSLTALHFGIRVRDITLLPIGGIARLETLPERPLHELFITLAGPMVNFALVIILVLVLALVGGAGLFLDLDHLAYLLAGPRTSALSLIVYLLAANLLLGLFNLLPAFPMDGGRVLRAFLAMWTSYPRATLIAARVGQLMAVGLVLLAITPFGNISLALIALFVFTGASVENQAVQARAIAQGLRVRNALPVRRARVVAPEDTLASVMELTYRERQHDFPVFQEGRLVGMLSRNNLLAAIRQGGGYVRVEKAMQREYPTVSPEDRLLRAQEILAQTGLSALPVFHQGHFMGLISLEDINRAYANLSWRYR